jgi:hypothetical protein
MDKSHQSGGSSRRGSKGFQGSSLLAAFFLTMLMSKSVPRRPIKCQPASLNP